MRFLAGLMQPIKSEASINASRDRCRDPPSIITKLLKCFGDESWHSIEAGHPSLSPENPGWPLSYKTSVCPVFDDRASRIVRGKTTRHSSFASSSLPGQKRRIKVSFQRRMIAENS